MSTEEAKKINQLLNTLPHGIVVTSGWLADHGYSFDLQKRYRKSGWLDSIGHGAMKRRGTNVSIEGGVYALQRQMNMSVHPGGKTALAMLGRSHYLQLSIRHAMLFGQPKEVLPRWFNDYKWGPAVDYHATALLPPDMGMTEFEAGNFAIKISGPVRALMECLYLYPKEQDLSECFEIMESLNSLRPDVVSELLALCSSVKVKRLFTYLAEKAGHGWFKHVTLDKVDFGHGKRSLAEQGVYIPKYQITVPRELEK